MNKFIASLSLLGLVLSASAFAGPQLRPIESLRDLPSHWTGVAGGLLSKAPATFTIDKITKIDRQEPGHEGAFFSALYDTTATMSLGERTLGVVQVGLMRYQASDQLYYITIYTNDELTPTVFGVVSYDETSDTYKLQEMPRTANERRFIFTAAASGHAK